MNDAARRLRHPHGGGAFSILIAAVALGAPFVMSLRGDDTPGIPAATRFPLGSSGNLELTVPTSWTVEVRRPAGSQMPILEFTSKSDPDWDR